MRVDFIIGMAVGTFAGAFFSHEKYRARAVGTHAGTLISGEIGARSVGILAGAWCCEE